MKRILIIGTSASGKTRLSRKLAEKLNVPLFHLDSIYWKDGWVEDDSQAVQKKIDMLLAKEEWIIEGYIEPLAERRLERATEVIYLDLPGYLLLLNGIKRWLKHRKNSRPELPQNNTDQFSLSFMMTLLRRDERKEIEKLLSKHTESVTRLTKPRHISRYLDSIVK